MSSCVCNNNYTNNNMKYEVYTCIWYEVRITLSIEILLYKYIEQCLLLYNISPTKSSYVESILYKIEICVGLCLFASFCITIPGNRHTLRIL